MTPHTDRADFGIQVLKVICLVGFILSMVGVIFAVHPTHFVPAVQYGRLHRAIAFLDGLLMGGLFYGIQRRLTIAWNFGWVLLILVFADFLISTLASILRQTPEPGGWIASAVVAVLISGIAAYWGRWWKHQKGYFSRPGL